MKKAIAIGLACLLVMSLWACAPEEDVTTPLLMAVLNSDKTFITGENTAILLQDYPVGGASSGQLAVPTEYCFVDFDRDNTDEMVVNISDDYGIFLVLRAVGYDVYGFEFGIRAMHSIKTDGSFIASNGAASVYYCELAFDENQPNVVYTAVKDSTADHFELDGRVCSMQELNEYINDWEQKEDVQWIPCAVSPTETEPPPAEVETIPIETDPAATIPTETEQVQTTPPAHSTTTVDLSQYVSVHFSGVNLGGRSNVEFDKERFLLDHIHNISYNPANLAVYRELYGNTDVSAASAILKYIHVDTAPGTKLSNGDSVELVWNIDTEKVQTYFLLDYICPSRSFPVSGLPEAASFDPFDSIDVSFSGTAPFGEAHFFDFDPHPSGIYSIAPETGLKNGDQVTVHFSCREKEEMISLHGEYPSATEMTFTVSGLPTYVQSPDEIPAADFDKLVSYAADMVWVTGFGVYQDAEFCGCYFYTAKDQPAHGVHFLKWCGTPVGNAVCFVFRHPRDSENDAPTVYTVYALENLQLDENGSLINNRHEMWKYSDDYTSVEELRAEFSDRLSDVMRCLDCTNFD